MSEHLLLPTSVNQGATLSQENFHGREYLEGHLASFVVFYPIIGRPNQG